MYFINGDIYSGKWDADMFEGQGKMIYAHGPYAYYEGSWSAGKRHGQGKCVYRQGEKFTEVNGSWSKNQTKGKCHIKYADGSIYGERRLGCINLLVRRCASLNIRY